jgi:hypothetical protein
VTTYTQLFATSLCTGLFAFSWTMTLLSTTMCTAAQLLPTNFRASYFVQMTWLVLESSLPAEAGFGGKEWTYRTVFIVSMAVMRYLRVTTIL